MQQQHTTHLRADARPAAQLSLQLSAPDEHEADLRSTQHTCAWMPDRLRSFFSSSLSPLAASLLVLRITCEEGDVETRPISGGSLTAA